MDFKNGTLKSTVVSYSSLEMYENVDYSNGTRAGVNETTIFHPWTKACAYIAMILQWINAVLILSLNAAVILTIVRCKYKSRLYFLLLNMAIADLLTGVVDAWVNALERSFGISILDVWWFGDKYSCISQRWAASVALCASNFILAATSVDRAFVVARPLLHFKRGFVVHKSIIFVCWISACIISSPLLHYCKLTESLQEKRCDYKLDDNGHKWRFIMQLVFYILIPLLVIIVSYTILVYAIYKRARTPPNSIHGMDNLKIALVINRGLPSSKSRSIKLTFGIVLSFIISWSPFCIGTYMALYHHWYHPVSMIILPTFYWNCVANPIMFFVYHRNNRRDTSQSSYSNGTYHNKTSYSTRKMDNTQMKDKKNCETMQMNQMIGSNLKQIL